MVASHSLSGLLAHNGHHVVAAWGPCQVQGQYLLWHDSQATHRRFAINGRLVQAALVVGGNVNNSKVAGRAGVHVQRVLGSWLQERGHKGLT